jgi:hypothetical protein
MVYKDALTQDASARSGFSSMSSQDSDVTWSENFGAKTLTGRKSKPEVVTTGRFEPRTRAVGTRVSTQKIRSDSRGSGDTGPPKSETAMDAPPEVVFRSTSGRRRWTRTSRERVPYEFPGPGSTPSRSKATKKKFSGTP